LASAHQLNLMKMYMDNEIKRLKNYAEAEKYYRNQTNCSLPSKYEAELQRRYPRLRANYCRPVIDTMAGRLKVTNVRCEDKKTAAYLQDVWRKNKMDKYSLKNLKQAIKLGDSFILVWPDDENKTSKITVLDPATCFPMYADDDGTMLWFKRQWVGFDKDGNPAAFKFIYYPDRVERFIYKVSAVQILEKTSLSQLAVANWEDYTEDGLPASYNHSCGIPFVHFANRADECPFGESELQDVFGLQDALNIQLHILMNVGEFSGFMQGVITGVVKQDFETDENGDPIIRMTAGDFLTISDTEARAYMLPQSSPDGVISVIDETIDVIAETTLTPRSALEASAGNAITSGYALSKAEAPLIRKCEEGQTNFGCSYEEVFSLVIQQARIMGISEVAEIDAYPEWMPLTDESPTDKLTRAQENAIYVEQKVVSRQYVQRELGLTQDEIDKILDEIKQEDEAAIDRAIGGMIHGSGELEDED